MTTETPAMTQEQIEARLTEIAPPPQLAGEVTAEGMARYLLVRTQLGWSRNLTPFVRDDQLVPVWQIAAQFAAAHSLMALISVHRAAADEAARQIAAAWDDGAGIGEWTWEHLSALGVDPAEVRRLDEARLAAEDAGRAGTEGLCCSGCGPGCACGGSPHEASGKEETDGR